MMEQVIIPSEWYDAPQATEVLSRNSGRPVHHDYVRTLARNKAIRSFSIGRAKLYSRADVDAYKVSATPGPKPKPGTKLKGKGKRTARKSPATELWQ